MKGAVFIALNDFVETLYGIDRWEAILAEVNPKSGGIYTSVQNYDDAEMVALVHTICKQLGVTRAQALGIFGEYLFGVLNTKYPIFTSLQPDFFKFLACVESIVHTEVRKLFSDVKLPLIVPVETGEDKIVLRYESERQMCELAEGLIHGAAKFYDVNIKMGQACCYHQGDDHCLIEVMLV